MIDKLQHIPAELWALLAEMAPFLLFGFLFAGILSVVISTQFVTRHLGGSGPWPVIKATIFGIPLPLCSCGVIPVGASLRRSGASKGATAGFLASTPETGVDSFLVTLSLMGPVFAIYRLVTSFLAGLCTGVAVDLFDKDDTPAKGAKAEGMPEQAECCSSQHNGMSGCEHNHSESAVPRPDRTCCEDTDSVRQDADDCCASEASDGCCGEDTSANQQSWLVRAMRYALVTLPQDLARSLVVGVLIAALVSVFVPDDFLAGTLGAGIWGMLAMMVVSLPFYVCATASVPIAAALLLKGISPGAALVFLMTGPATNAATITTIWRVMGMRTTVIYLLSIAGIALAAGLTFNSLFGDISIPDMVGQGQMLPAIVGHTSAVVLLVILAVALLPERWRRRVTP